MGRNSRRTSSYKEYAYDCLSLVTIRGVRLFVAYYCSYLVRKVALEANDFSLF